MMTTAQARYIDYYLTYAQGHPDDWDWFQREWPQIQHAWEWRSGVKTTVFDGGIG